MYAHDDMYAQGDPPPHLSVAAQLLERIIRLIPEMDEDILWTWYAEGSFNPPAYRDFPELATRADELIQAVHEELKKRLLNQGP